MDVQPEIMTLVEADWTINGIVTGVSLLGFEIIICI